MWPTSLLGYAGAHILALYIDGIQAKGPYPPCLRMADRALLAGYPWYVGIFTDDENIFSFSVISQNWDSAHSSKFFLKETKDPCFLQVDTVAVDAPAMQGTRALAATVLT